MFDINYLEPSFGRVLPLAQLLGPLLRESSIIGRVRESSFGLVAALGRRPMAVVSVTRVVVSVYVKVNLLYLRSAIKQLL